MDTTEFPPVPPAGPSVGPPVEPRAVPPRKRHKTAIRVTAIIAGALVVLAGIGALAGHPTGNVTPKVAVTATQAAKTKAAPLKTSAAARVPTSYLDKNGFACAPAQASSDGFCPDDPASKPSSQPADSPTSSAASSTVAAPAPAPKPSPSISAPAAAPSTRAPTAAPSTSSGCYPISDEGTCYEPGEYCRDSDHGVSGVAGDGESITCEDNDGWRWEPRA
jgi:hypothetical protein